MKVVFWGTYDTGKPRNRILIRGLRENGVQIEEIHYDLWSGVEDKSQVKGLWKKSLFVLKCIASYPNLVYRFLKTPRHDAVIVGYLGQLDVLIIWMFAKIKKTTVIWDAFISLHDTVVSDRKLISKYNPLSFLIYIWEALACRAADLVILDTTAHAKFFIEHYNLSADKVRPVFVGAEPEIFPLFQKKQVVGNDQERNFSVLFYGQFIPLHGIETIIQAAQLLEKEPIDWLLIGQGQEAGNIQNLLNEHPLTKLSWKKWVKYSDLVLHIHEADICLGIFGNSPKASRVIPNKLFQIVASGKPVITRDSPAIRELITEPPEDVVLVPPASPEELANALMSVKNILINLPTESYLDLGYETTPRTIGHTFRSIIEKHINK